MSADASDHHAAELAQVRRERDVAIAIAARALTEKLGANVHQPVLAAAIRERIERERQVLLDSASEALPS